MVKEELRTVLGLPPVTQIGVVVRDIDKAVKFYTSIFGIGPFYVYEFIPEKHWYHEKPSPLKLLMAKAPWGSMELELVQPLEGKTIHKEFLDTHGEGLQHLGFDVPDYESLFEKFVKSGFKPLQRIETYYGAYNGYAKACYFDTREVGGVVFEIMWRSWVKKD
jgi:4-hydroxyphenylpyruvate dioxygenase-like putative hemolysin